MSFTPLAKGRYLEALAIDEHAVWFSDVILGGVQGFDWFHPRSGRTGTLLSSIDGVPLSGVNEMCPDGSGGLFFGTLDLPAIVKGERPAPVALYRLDVRGKVTLLSDGLVFCNGLGMSADGTTLYHNESFVGTFAYGIAPDGSLDNRRMLLEKPDCDGMSLDIRGNLWITGFSSEELLCVRPDGAIDRRLALPGGACTNVRFGGADGRDLFVTTVPLTAGLEIAKGNLPAALDSVLYRGPSPVPGRINARTQFRLV